jgi:hypothetical protein
MHGPQPQQSAEDESHIPPTLNPSLLIDLSDALQGESVPAVTLGAISATLSFLPILSDLGDKAVAPLSQR